MKITNIEYFKIERPLRVPYEIAYENVSHVCNIILKVSTSAGIIGWGSAAPDNEVNGETPESVIINIENNIIPMLMGSSPFQIAKFNHLMKIQSANCRASMAMVDMALFDILARKAKLPLYQVLGGYRTSIPTSITIGILPITETLKEVKNYLEQKFSIIKIKGGLDFNEDIEKILKVREQFGKDFSIRFDANQGYTSKESIEFINKTKSAGIEIFEQPTPIKKDEGLGQVTRNTHVPVMADESMRTLNDAFRLARNDIIDMINIKLMKVGGIYESQHINSVAKAAGVEVMVGCIDEFSLSISAGLHFALSRPNVEYADLDGHLEIHDDPFKDLFTLKEGVMYPSDHPGLGNVNL